MSTQEKGNQLLEPTVRSVDSLGRVVLPFDVRRLLVINDGDSLLVSIEDGQIILEKVDVTDGE